MSENQEQPMENLDDLRAQRVQKLNKIVENGGNAYGHRVDDITPSTVVKEIAPTLAEGEVKKVRVAGRMIARRIMGKSLFASLRDRNDSIQLYVQKNVVGDDEYAKFKELDLGDIISAEGEIFVTRTGEPSIRAEKFELLSKCLPGFDLQHGRPQDVRTAQQDHLRNPQVLGQPWFHGS